MGNPASRIIPFREVVDRLDRRIPIKAAATGTGYKRSRLLVDVGSAAPRSGRRLMRPWRKGAPERTQNVANRVTRTFRQTP